VLPERVTTYRVEDGRVTSYRTVRREGPAEVRAGAPRSHLMVSLTDPSGRVLLVRIASGPHRGMLVSPDDPGVRFTAER
jgi:hypothetical protein